MGVRKVIGTNPRRMKKNSEQDKIRIIAVDTSTDLASRLTDLLGKDKADVCRESSIDRVLESFESEPYDVLIITSAAFTIIHRFSKRYMRDLT